MLTTHGLKLRVKTLINICLKVLTQTMEGLEMSALIPALQELAR